MSVYSVLLGSLRRKVVFGYGGVVALVVGLSVFSLVEMRVLEQQIGAGERIGRFFGLALEIRRFEKNYFLYRETADLNESRAYVARAQTLLLTDGAAFASLASAARIDALRATLDAYDALMADLALEQAPDPALEGNIRQMGKEIVSAAEAWSRAERVLLQNQLERHRYRLLLVIFLVVILVVIGGHRLSWRIARPLKALERNMAAVADGRLARLDMSAQDSEIASLTHAFNHVLSQLETRQGQLVRAEKLAALGTLLSGVAHELNNPLSNISTSCEILGEELASRLPDAEGAFEKELLGQIDAETWRARRIVRNLLDYARDRPFERQAVFLAQLAEDSLRLMRGRVSAQVELRLEIASDLRVVGDRQRLQQVFFNLVGNALDAVEGAGEIRVTARRLAGVSRIEIEVADNGHGIAPEALPRIFDPFFTTKEIGHGLGLGLFIAHEIIVEHGGDIAVHSMPGRGTRFLIRLPMQDTPP